ncbi:tRNA (guanosine(46)-N7)-methyltransferase TrmB [Thioalkalicoccus limnaeus]|uniref:tRNA (guanine-N(7)-)-methyltransferase n=1 Tax=Thioalkalicoccus limnaeus TaxID=120681 RepID=A0ABV4BG34_9GAMM
MPEPPRALDPRPHRPIRSFVLREGRLTAAQQRAFVDLWPRFGVDWGGDGPLDLGALFGNDQPVVVEIGFGNGAGLAELAERHPERNYLGIEVHRPGIGHLLLEGEQRGLQNLRILRHDAVEVLTQGLAPASLVGVMLYFPDPWPKKRHHKRRILNEAFVAQVARVLQPGGLFHAATDWEAYAEQMLAILSASAAFENAAGPGRYAPRPDERPMTRFERRGLGLGHPVRDLVFRRR